MAVVIQEYWFICNFDRGKSKHGCVCFGSWCINFIFTSIKLRYSYKKKKKNPTHCFWFCSNIYIYIYILKGKTFRIKYLMYVTFVLFKIEIRLCSNFFFFFFLVDAYVPFELKLDLTQMNVTFVFVQNWISMWSIWTQITFLS